MSIFWEATKIFRIPFESIFKQVDDDDWKSINGFTIRDFDISLTSSTKFCHDVDAYLQRIENPVIEEEYDHKVIFKFFETLNKRC